MLADGTNSYLYVNGPLAQYQAEMQYFGADGLGSVRQLYDASGAVIGSSRYDPFGNVMSQSGAASSAYGFTGEWTDATGLVHLRARYYSAAQGRFTTRDLWAGDPNAPMSYNAWNYTNGNPVNLTDPSGHCAIPPGQPPGVEWKMAYMTYTSSDRGYSGNLNLQVGRALYLDACRPCQLSVESHSWGAVSGNPGVFDPIPPDTYIVDPSMRRSNESWGRDICFGPWCPFGMKWNEDSWGKERLSLKYKTGQGAPYFIHGGNETRGTAGCIKVKNSDLTTVLDEIQSVGYAFKLFVSSDYSEPEPPPEWTGGAPA